MDVSTDEKTWLWQAEDSEMFVLLCELSLQTNPRISLGNRLGLH